MTEHPRGTGYWKLNQKLLEDLIFVEKTSEFIRELFSHSVGTANQQVVWEAFKCTFRGHTIKMASYRQKYLKRTEYKKDIEILTKGEERCTEDTLDKLEQKQRV